MSSESAAPAPPTTPIGLRTFAVVCFGQVASLFGSRLSSFALGVWVFQTTGSATQYALISVAMIAPTALLSPLIGALVDRWDRRRTLILADAGAAAVSVVLIFLVWSGRLSVEFLYLAVALESIFQSFQEPAFAASTPLLVPRRHLARANGAVQAGRAAALVVGPLAAGLLLEPIGLMGLLLVDLGTFGIAVLTLVAVRIPRPPKDPRIPVAEPSLIREALEGWHYLHSRRGLEALLLLAFGLNFTFGIVNVLLTPLVLTFASSAELGGVLTAASLGMLVGGVAMSLWGGPQRLVRGILLAAACQGLILTVGVLRPSVLLVGAAAFGYLLFNPIILSCSHAVWQSKVPPGLQGRVQALREMAGSVSLGVAFLAAGPLADFVFEPLMAGGGSLAGSLGPVFGVGPGRGIALLMTLMGLLTLLTVAVTLRYRPLMRLEEELPDAIPDDPVHDTLTLPSPQEKEDPCPTP